MYTSAFQGSTMTLPFSTLYLVRNWDVWIRIAGVESVCCVLHFGWACRLSRAGRDGMSVGVPRRRTDLPAYPTKRILISKSNTYVSIFFLSLIVSLAWSSVCIACNAC